MKLYNIDPQNIYPNAEVVIIPDHKDRAVIRVNTTMSDTLYYPRETEWHCEYDGGELLNPQMGLAAGEETELPKDIRGWVEEWSYPVEMAKKIVAQLNRK